jgi:hypothetical protein
MARGNGDDPAAVGRNRDAVRAALGFTHPPLALRQSHGDRVEVVRSGNLGELLETPPEADAFVTALRGVPLMVLTADCMPVVVCDPRTPVLAVIHAGWRGTALEIAGKAVRLMVREFGTRPVDCLAAVGPGIAPGCYEVGDDVRRAFAGGASWGGEAMVAAAGGGRWRADLREANRRQLAAEGIPGDSIAVCPYCTHCEPERYFSARRDGVATGRQATVAVLL